MTNRPTSFDTFIGQEHLLNNLKVMVGGALFRQEPAPHMLFMGPPGLGKTSLANLIAAEMGSTMVPVLGPMIKREADIASILTGLMPNDVLFIDECHALPRKVSETLYTAVEDFVLDVMVGPKQCPRPLRLNLPPFTLVGATTHPGGISGPLRDRFGYVGKVCFYSPEELGLIISGAAYANDMVIHSDVALILARASRGTPRVAIRLVERARDIAQSEQNYRITTEIALRAMDLAGIDEQGLDTTDRKVLKLLLQAAAPVGLSTMAASLGEEESTLSDMVEPYLLRMGLIQKLPNGRVITQAGVDALRVPGIEADNG